jgi:hypothetical protein
MYEAKDESGKYSSHCADIEISKKYVSYLKNGDRVYEA